MLEKELGSEVGWVVWRGSSKNRPGRLGLARMPREERRTAFGVTWAQEVAGVANRNHSPARASRVHFSSPLVLLNRYVVVSVLRVDVSRREEVEAVGHDDESGWSLLGSFFSVHVRLPRDYSVALFSVFG